VRDKRILWARPLQEPESTELRSLVKCHWNWRDLFQFSLPKPVRLMGILAAMGLLAACGAGGSNGAVSVTGLKESIGGTLTGMAGGTSVVLQDNGADNLQLSSNGAFTFPTAIPQGSTYAVTVLTEPIAQACSVSGGTGTANANVTTVAVNCASMGTPFTVSVTVSGLASGTSLQLQDNGTDNLTVTANGTAQFATPLANGAPYLVTVLAQPSTQTCTLRGSSGAIASANVTVQVVCNADNAGLTGNYSIVTYDIASATDTLGLGMFDGSGSYSESYDQSTNGIIAANQAANGSYSIGTGMFSLEPSGGIPYAGGIQMGSYYVGIGMTVSANSNPSLLAVAKKGFGMSMAQCAGNYVGAGFAVYASSPTGAVIDGGTLVVNADGSGGFDGTNNSGGTLGPEHTLFAAGGITLAADGSLVLPFSAANSRVGVVTPDYNFMITADEQSGDGPYIFAAVRTTPGSNAGLLDGHYSVVTYTGGLTGGYSNASGQSLTLVMDGNGNYTLTGTQNKAGVVSTVTGSGTYTVENDGSMALSSSVGEHLSGGVSPNGAEFVLYQVSFAQAPELWLGVAQ
jgi:hypothetical protein